LPTGTASTIHKSQGETVDRAFVLGTAGLYREAGYVALSRAPNQDRPVRQHQLLLRDGYETLPATDAPAIDLLPSLRTSQPSA